MEILLTLCKKQKVPVAHIMIGKEPKRTLCLIFIFSLFQRCFSSDKQTSPLEFTDHYSEKLAYMPHTFFIGDHKNMFPHLMQKVILWERRDTSVLDNDEDSQVRKVSPTRWKRSHCGNDAILLDLTVSKTVRQEGYPSSYAKIYPVGTTWYFWIGQWQR